ncbi:MAG: alpha/beta hydrolase [Flavobacteriaceae bacterium]|nr:alpha/beta hydrolase [Flavobacteriaceae bacterium]
MNNYETYQEIEINIDSIKLKGNLRIAKNSKGLIIFSHGSGSSRLSTRNNYVANLLRESAYSSLLFDLLTPEEDVIYENRFNIEMLTKRLVKVTQWVCQNEEISKMPIGYFGASTGAASALGASVYLKDKIKALVSRGGRPDLAMSVLDTVVAPTLLIVGGKDYQVIELNKLAQSKMKCICEIKIVERATHLFSESGALDNVAALAIKWFDKYLTIK